MLGLPTSSAIPICLPMYKSFRIAVIFRKLLNLTQTKKCQGRQPRGAQICPGGLSHVTRDESAGLYTPKCDIGNRSDIGKGYVTG